MFQTENLTVIFEFIPGSIQQDDVSHLADLERALQVRAPERGGCVERGSDERLVHRHFEDNARQVHDDRLKGENTARRLNLS